MVDTITTTQNIVNKPDLSASNNNQAKQPAAKKTVARPQISPNNDLKDTYASSKKKSGFIAKFYNLIGNHIPVVMSDRKVQNKLVDYHEGKASKKDAQDYINRYENANFNNSELTIDGLATMASMGVGFAGKKIKRIMQVFTPKYKNYATAIIGGASVLAGLGVKLGLKGIDNLGKDKEARKQEKRFGATVATGTLDGITGALSAVNPLLVPVGLGINAFARYVNDRKDDKTLPSIGDFLEKQKDTIGIGALSLAGVSCVAAKGHFNLAKIEKAIKNTAINKEHVISYKPPEGQLTEFQQLARDIGYDLGIIIKDGKFHPENISKLDEDFMKILLERGQNGNIEGKIKKIEKENIFLPKYLQTVVDIPEEKQQQLVKQIDQLVEGYNKRKAKTTTFYNRDYSFSVDEYGIDEAMKKMEKEGMDVNGFKDLQQIIKRIKSACPTSRTIDQAQSMLDKEYGGAYKITKLLGVGSIAESYLATDKSGKEIVIKIVKQHFLDTDKIAQDKAKVLKKVEDRAKPDYSFLTSKQTIKTPERKKYDLNQLDNMYKVWGDELNLNMEAQSARDIGSQAISFHPVGVIDSKPNIFIMEKAQGYQLDSDKIAKKWKEEGLTEGDFKNLVENYVKVYCEQLFSLPKKGEKVVQSDPHGGNIMVDLGEVKRLRTDKNAKAITIIDYGNTTRTKQEQAIKNLFSHIDYLVGNTDAIAATMLEGAQLGNNKKEEVVKELSEALAEKIYNVDTKIDVDNPVKIFSTVNSFCIDFMQKKNIIPNASNINQMKAEETYIVSNLGCLYNIASHCNFDLAKAIDRDTIIKQLVTELSNATQDAMKINPKLTGSEIMKRYNFFTNHTEEALSSLGINFGIV